MTIKEAKIKVYQQCGNCAHWMADMTDAKGKPIVNYATCRACHYVWREADDWCKKFEAAAFAIREILESESEAE